MCVRVCMRACVRACVCVLKHSNVKAIISLQAYASSPSFYKWTMVGTVLELELCPL